jgi:hypothetical protein
VFEYHGWITVRETAAAEDDDEPRLRQIVDELRLHIARMDSPYLLDLRWMNGEPFIHLGGFSNHRSPDVIHLFEHVAAVAPGSYGLLHVHDDEEPGHENDVRVLKLVRGRVTQHTEPLLSPYIPTVEDPCTG